MTRKDLMKEIDQYIEDHKDTFYSFDPETGFDENGNLTGRWADQQPAAKKETAPTTTGEQQCPKLELPQHPCFRKPAVIIN